MAYFDEIRGVFKCEQTMSFVFDMSSQSKIKLKKTGLGIIKTYSDYYQKSKQSHNYGFFCFIIEFEKELESKIRNQ